MYIVVIKAKNTIPEVCRVKDTNSMLDRLQEKVGGHIEIVRPRKLRPPYCMVVNEDGLALKLAVNAIGSWLYETDKHGSPIVGDIVIAKEAMTPAGMDIVPLTSDDVAEVICYMEEAKSWVD